MLKEISFKNYRAFKEGTIKLSPITILVGENNCGKSSVNQLLRILFQTANESVEGPASININGSEMVVLDATDIIHNRDENKNLSLSLKFSSPSVDEFNYSYNERFERLAQEAISIVARRILHLEDTDTKKGSNLKGIRRLQRNFSKPTFTNKDIDNLFDQIEGFTVDEKKNIVEIFQSYQLIREFDKNPFTLNRNQLDKLIKKAKDEITFSIFYAKSFRDLLAESDNLILKGVFSIQRNKNGDAYLATNYYAIELQGRILFEKTRDGISKLNTLKNADNDEFVDLSDIQGDNETYFDFDTDFFSHLSFYKRFSRVPWLSYLSRLAGYMSKTFINSTYIHVGPHRSKVPHTFTLSDNINLDDHFSTVIRSHISDPDFLEKRFNKIAKQLGFELKINKIYYSTYRLEIVSNGNKNKYELSSVGFGISQLIPILSCILDSGSGETIIVEQPEAHLHPKLHAVIADLFIVFASVNKTKFIIETHSDHFLSRISRRMRDDTPLKNDEYCLFSVQRESDNSIIKPLERLDSGDFIWPEGFITSKIEDEIGVPQLPTYQ